MRDRSTWIAVVAMAACLVAYGCGTLPVQPRPVSGAGTGASPVAGATGGGVRATITQPPTTEDPSKASTLTIDGSVGGTIQVKNVSVIVPQDCYSGDAQIKVTLPDSLKLQVQLEIDPPDMNHFDVPVRLQFDVSSSGQDPRVMVIYWHDPSDNQWVAIPTTVDVKTGRVYADLQHFSEYECVSEIQGKAGW